MDSIIADKSRRIGEDEARAYAARVARRSGSTFYLPMLMLPPEKRDAMLALYAFCRVVDDITDGHSPEPEKLAAIDEWRQEIDRFYDRRPMHPVTIAMSDALHRYDFPKDDFYNLIAGFEMDIGGEMLRPDLRRLETYSYRVAGCVGLLSIRVFGYHDTACEQFAIELGHALQFTNMLRDIDEDIQRGRLYLPYEWLQEEGLEATPPRALLSDPRLANVLARMVAKAEQHFSTAEHLLPERDRQAMVVALLMGRFYRALLERLKRIPPHQLPRNVHLTWMEKCRIIAPEAWPLIRQRWQTVAG